MKTIKSVSCLLSDIEQIILETLLEFIDNADRHKQGGYVFIKLLFI